MNFTQGFTTSLEEFNITSKVLDFNLIKANKEIVTGSIFEYLQTALNLNLGFSDRYLHLEKLDNNLANLLNLATNDPAMIVLEQIYLSSGVCFNVSKLVYNYKNTRFFLQS